MQAEWLPVLMNGSFSEIYVFDCETLALVEANVAAGANMGYDAAELVTMCYTDLAPNYSPQKYRTMLEPLCSGSAERIDYDTAHRRKDGSRYPVELRLFHVADRSPPVFVAIGNDLSGRHASDEALRASESRFRAIVSNTPGLVYQFRLNADQSIAFPYLSEGCHALLGMTAEQLSADPALFLNLILPDDRQSYLDSRAASAIEMKGWNWEGRIWIEAWKDIKWINLRATPRTRAADSVQWEGIMTNITESKLEEEEIKRSRAQLAELSAHVETVKENERTRIAREIHDDMGGNLTAIKMALALLTRRLPEGDAFLAEKAAYADSLVDRTIEAIHRIAGDLRPSILDFGLVAAIDWQAREFEKQWGIPCKFTSNKKDIELHEEQATALFRIFQEAMTNISKHAQATRVAIRLVRTNRTVRMEIEDNGRGIGNTDRNKPKSFGIRGMVERAIALGGNLSINAGPDGGSVVAIKIPL